MTRLISLVLPAHNEAGNIAAVHSQVRRCFGASDLQVEMIFVDDGSSDATAARVTELCAADPLVRLVRLSRNFGNQAAILAGLEKSRGDAVILMDCDLQHPPELLPLMVEAWSSGALIVQMDRRETQGESWFRRTATVLYKRLIDFLSDAPLVLSPDFELLDRRVVDVILRFRNSRPFVRGLVAWIGFPMKRIEFVAPVRLTGASSFTLGRLLRLALDGVTALSIRPLRVAIYAGVMMSLLALLFAAILLWSYLHGSLAPGWTLTLLTILVLGSMQLLSLGVLGEYVGRTYEVARQVPPYIILEEINAETTQVVADSPAQPQLPVQDQFHQVK